MVGWRNDAHGWGGITQTIHWLTAVGVLCLLSLGFVMTRFWQEDLSLIFSLYQNHKSIGFTVFALSVIRIAWRLANPAPSPISGLEPWRHRVAEAVHYTMLVLLIALPISGWFVVSSTLFQVPTKWFGLFQIPHLMGPNEAFNEIVVAIHHWLAWLMAVLVTVHITAAIQHRMSGRTDVINRMLPWRR